MGICVFEMYFPTFISAACKEVQPENYTFRFDEITERV
jgi:hypothetical protein